MGNLGRNRLLDGSSSLSFLLPTVRSIGGEFRYEIPPGVFLSFPLRPS